MLSVAPYRVAATDSELDDLSARLRAARWPPDAPGESWQQGTDLGFLRGLADYWSREFDWRQSEAALNVYPQFTAQIDGIRIHFVHVRARRANGIPLILTHGWPSAFVEYLPVLDMLVDPAHADLDGPAFDVVVPSLPGYCFSERPRETGVNYRRVASIWHQLMKGLGYDRYGVGGGDFGAGVVSLIALDQPQSVIGVHLTNFELLPEPAQIAGSMTLAEDAFFHASDAWWQREKGYKQIQSTKPQTLSYGLTDSPIALAAWILEKWRSWTDCGGDVVRKFGIDFLLQLVTLYWLSGSMATSIRDYYDNRWHPSLPDPGHRIERPTAFAVFGHGFAGEPEPPRSLVERLYNVTRWTEMPRGGHFAPIEQPGPVAKDIAEFFADLT